MKKKFTKWSMAIAFLAMTLLLPLEATAKTLYLDAGGSSKWDQGGAWFSAWVWGSSKADAWYRATKGDVYYEIEVPDDATGMKWVRFSKVSTSESWTQADGDKNGYWNQTGNLTIGADNLLTIKGWGTTLGTDYAWSTYEAPAPDPVITVTSALPEFPTTTVGETSTATVTYTLENATEATATIEGEGFSIAEQSVGSVTITFAPEAEGEYTATLTITSGDVKETVAVKATAIAPEAPKVPEILHVSAAEFAEIMEGETTSATVTYELLNAEEATATVEGEGFAITEQEVGSVTIEFTAATAGDYTGKLIITSGETVKEVALAATVIAPTPIVTIKVATPANWESCYIWAWTATGNLFTEGWPGKAMTKGEDGFYAIDIETAESISLLVSDNGQDSKKTADYTVGVTESTCFDIDNNALVINSSCEYQVIPEPDPIDPYAAIRGLGEGTEEEVWSEEQQIKLAINEDAEQEEWFIKGLEIAEGQAFKVVYVNAKSETTWYGVTAVEENEELGSIGEDNITLAAGKYDLYFKIAGSIWIAPVKAEEPEPEPVVITFVDEVTFPKTFVGETTNDIIEFTLENAAEDADVVVEVTGEAFSVAEVQDNLIYLAFAPEAEGEYAGVLTVTVGEVSESLEFTAVASPVEPKIIITSELPEFPVTVIGETSEATITYEVENIDADADVSVSIQGEGFSGEDVDGTITIIFTPTEEKVYTGAVTITAGAVSQDVVLFAQAVAEEEPEEPKINIIVADFERNTAEVGDETDAAIVYSLENIESAEVEIEGEYVTFDQTEVEEGFMIAVYFRPEEVGEFPGKVIITAGEVTEEIEFTFIATEPEDDPIIPDPENLITFTVQVPEGTKECWVTGFPLWVEGEFLPMEPVEGEENMFTVTTTKDVIDGTAWKYCSGEAWQYAEVIEGNGDRTEPEDPYDVVSAWQKLYDPDFQPIDPYYAIRGDMTGWTDYKNDIKLTEDADNDQWYIKEFEVDGTEAFKVVYVDENANVCDDCWYSNIEEYVSTDIYTGGNGDNILLVEGKYDIYFKPGTGAMWIAKVIPDTPTDVEDAVAELIYAIDGTIYAPAPFAIIDLSGKDVTNANGSLQGTYIVKTQNSTAKISVK